MAEKRSPTCVGRVNSAATEGQRMDSYTDMGTLSLGLQNKR